MAFNEVMYKNWEEMIVPDEVQVESNNCYGKFVCEPLEKGYGTTIGNSLRRIILSSIWGAAITSVKFEGIMHEFSTIPGVLEDTSEIILNLKEVCLRMNSFEPVFVEIVKQGEGIIRAGDIISEDGRVEILNPELYIATLSAEGSLDMGMTVKAGKGYNLSEDNEDEEAPDGTIAIDAVFSPIQKVKYVVGNARIGQRTDYDKLSLEIWTDGSIYPEDAIAYAARIMQGQMRMFINFDERKVPEADDQTEDQNNRFNDNLYRSIEELELSVRSGNCLKNADILKIYQLVQKSEAEMLKTKNFGRKSLNEIKGVLKGMGLHLGMTLEGFVSPHEDLEEEEGEHTIS